MKEETLLEQMTRVRPEVLDENALKLFNKMMNKEEINYILESLKFKTSIYRDKYKRNLSFNDDEYYANVLNEYIEDLQQKLDKILTYTKKQCQIAKR